jgi:hypothetical protein
MTSPSGTLVIKRTRTALERIDKPLAMLALFFALLSVALASVHSNHAYRSPFAGLPASAVLLEEAPHG